MSAAPRPAHRALPRFFVSARHGTLGRGDQGASGWQPFGVQHARMVAVAFMEEQRHHFADLAGGVR
jgi:hypothetical protein